MDPTSIEPEVEDGEASQRRRIDLQPNQCIFCLRIMKNGTTEHHLIPRHCHRKRWFKARYTRRQMNQTVPACRLCHNAIHRLIPDEKQLGRELNTVEALLAHPPFARFLKWAKKQK